MLHRKGAFGGCCKGLWCISRKGDGSNITSGLQHRHYALRDAGWIIKRSVGCRDASGEAACWNAEGGFGIVGLELLASVCCMYV